jgi:DNA polymerase I-like protein with 3'-5' exonuclease and polymerase domains
MPRLPKFQNTDDPFHVQGSLFLPPGVREGENHFPPILRDNEGLRAVLYEAQGGIGTDLEFNPDNGRPSILGVSSRQRTAAVPWDADLAREVIDHAQRSGQQLIGHSVIGADKPIYEGALGIHTPLDLWDDTMIRHYLAHPDFCKTPGKEEDDDDTGAMGFMNLWTMSSLHTDLPVWKSCRGKACAGPCPLHDPFGYCAVDSWAGLEAKYDLDKVLASRGIPEQLVRDLTELTEITVKMETRGIKVDRAYIAEMETNFEAVKLKLFGEDAPFNPKSTQQVKEFFSKYGITFPEGYKTKGTDKKTIKKVLERQCKQRGIPYASLETAETLPYEIEWLSRTYQFKDAGKGLKSWFDDRYIDQYAFAHPRFIPTGTSMGRLASSKPNFTNIPARGFGAAVKQAVVPPTPADQERINQRIGWILGLKEIEEAGYDLLKADYSQLELRKMLFLGGYDLRKFPEDPFTDLVVRTSGALKPAAEAMHGSERDVAKTLFHAGNYFEGIQVLNGKDIERRKKEIEVGALKVFTDWEYAGGVVAFTGANLAERIFGDKTWESRKKALEFQELVFREFPEIRNVHRAVTREIDEHSAVRSLTGRYLALYGSPEDNAKMGAAFKGQGGGADHVISVMLRYHRELQEFPMLMVHDELCWIIPRRWSEGQAKDFLRIMVEPTERMHGFYCAIKAKRGPNWGQMKWGDKKEIELVYS